jgi:glycosyltransferase involved in cell wall biosynthesis
MAIPPAQIYIVPNGVDVSAADSVASRAEPNTLIYNGAMTFAPNRDAMYFFVREALPLVRAQAPDVKLRITGHVEQVAQNELSEDNVVLFTGYLPDIKPLVKASTICIVPLRQGGGTRLKILEAMALRTPVVATTKGAEGLNVHHREHLLIADTPRAFADAILELLENPRLRETLTANAYAQVRREYDWNVIGEHLNRLLVECAPRQVC